MSNILVGLSTLLQLMIARGYSVKQILIYIIEATRLIAQQSRMPITVGKIAANSVHFGLPVSFWIVSRVVEQGQ